MGKLMSFSRKESNKNCIIVRTVFFPPYFKLSQKALDRNFPFLSENVYFKCT